MEKTEIVYKKTYKIFELTDGGTLRQPTYDYYGQDHRIFDTYGYNTGNEAIEAISKENKGGPYIVLTVIDGHYVL